MLAAYQDWKQGHSPVTQGRARWLPSPFIQAMHAVRDAIRSAEADAFERRTNG